MTETAELVNLIPASLRSLTGIFIFLAALAVVLMFCRKFLAALVVAKMRKWAEAYIYFTKLQGSPHWKMNDDKTLAIENLLWNKYKSYTRLAEVLGADWQPLRDDNADRYLQRHTSELEPFEEELWKFIKRRKKGGGSNVSA